MRRVVDDEGREVAPSPYWVEVLASPDARSRPRRRTGARGEIRPRRGCTHRARGPPGVALEGGSYRGRWARRRRGSRPSGCRPTPSMSRALSGDRARGVGQLPLRVVPRQLSSPRRSWSGHRPAFEGNLAHEALHRSTADVRGAVGPCGPRRSRAIARRSRSCSPGGQESAPPARGRRTTPWSSAFAGTWRRCSVTRPRSGRPSSRRFSRADGGPDAPRRRRARRGRLGAARPARRVARRRHGLVVDYKRSRRDFSIKSDDVTTRLPAAALRQMAK